MYRILHQKSDVARVYVPRHKGEKGLISCDTCIKSEENRLGWYVKQSNELMLKVASTKGIIKAGEAKKLEDLKKCRSTYENIPGRRKECINNILERWMKVSIKIKPGDG